MRKRLMAVAAVGLLIVGAWLGQLFQGFGLGEAESVDGQAESPPADVRVDLNAGSDVPPRVESSPAPEAVAAAPTPNLSDDMLTVLIESDSYQLQSGEDATASFSAASLEEVVEQAKGRPGDSHGIRVRLRYRRDSQEGARADLVEALQVAGIAREQIIEATGFVE